MSSLAAEAPSALDRLRIAEWANQERVRQASRVLCVGTATVIARDWERHALTAIQWLWTPVSPHQAVPTVSEGLEYCIAALVARRVRLPVSSDTLLLGVEQALRAEAIAGLDAPHTRKRTVSSVSSPGAKLDTLSDVDGSICVGWVGPDVLWARVRGRLNVGLASAYTSRLAQLLKVGTKVQFFIDASALESYELLARDLTTEFLVAQRQNFSRLVLLNWAGGMSSVGRTGADAMGAALVFVATVQDFDARLRLAAPSAAEMIAATDQPRSSRVGVLRRDDG